MCNFVERFLADTWTLQKGVDRAAAVARLRTEVFPAALASDFVYCVNSRTLDAAGASRDRPSADIAAFLDTIASIAQRASSVRWRPRQFIVDQDGTVR